MVIHDQSGSFHNFVSTYMTRFLYLPFVVCIFASLSAIAQLTRPDLSGFEPAQPELSELIAPDLTGPLPDSVSLSDPLSALRPFMIDRTLAPRVFSGYRHIVRKPRFTTFPDPAISRQVWRDSIACADLPDSIVNIARNARAALPVAFASPIPEWLSAAVNTARLQEDFVYSLMVADPNYIDYADWELPQRPVLPDEDFSFIGFLKRLDLPEISAENARIVTEQEPHKNWLHVFNVGLQLSQAYLSSNWYQGGNSYLAFLGNFLWDVQLNPVYFPKFLFQSTVSYKLAINSTPEDEFHKYSVSQDLFQYNLKMGLKAYHNWYYSFLAQFKTQFLHSYPSNSMVRSASFLSPGDLNLGLGMTYSKENEAKTLKFSASVSPISYQLKTCIDRAVDHAQFGIRPDRKWINEVGSNAEVNFYAKFFGNVSYTTRLFLFSDYSLFQADWENTLNFQFSRFFSTQIYAHLRYDTSADATVNRHWRKLMIKEILSVGLSYSFSTK